MIMKILKRGVVEKKEEEETKSMPHAPVIYADGSYNGDIISSAAVFRQLAVPSASSIISTKANTIRVALKFVVSADKSKLRVEKPKTFSLKKNNDWNVYHLFAIGNHIILTWILNHIGIHGNTLVEEEAKDTLKNSFTDFKPLIAKYILKCLGQS